MISQSDIKRIRSLKSKKGRQEHGQFMIEGYRLVKTYLENQAGIIDVYYTKSFKQQYKRFNLLSKNSEKELVLITEKLMSQISDAITPSGIICICKTIRTPVPNFSAQTWLYLYQLSDPGNTGSLLRTAAWFNIKNIAFSPYSIDPFNPKVVRSAMGAHIHIDIHINMGLGQFQDNNYLTIGADQNGKEVIDQFVSLHKRVIVLGGEAHGIGQTIKHKLDKIVSVPKMGYGESLNVAAAGAILMNQLSKK
ncbi:MAG: hypothetical protein CMG33_00660 [Candidatus Marinimicrobia bacterium]|nr:hypothetical protein [Candidatus Neomarinimicrobiota bacterium]